MLRVEVSLSVPHDSSEAFRPYVSHREVKPVKNMQTQFKKKTVHVFFTEKTNKRKKFLYSHTTMISQKFDNDRSTCVHG